MCASPTPIPVDELIERVDKEIAAPSRLKYGDNDQLAFIFVSAMKNAAYRVSPGDLDNETNVGA